MKDEEEYSFCTQITKSGCVCIPEQILEKLELERQVQIRIIPEKRKNKEKTFKTGKFEMIFRIIHNKNEILEKLQKTVAIEEDYLFLMQYYSPYNKEFDYLETPQLLGVLMKLYGEPDTFYDDYKSSFNYTFDCNIIYHNENPIREVNLVMKIYDYKESLYIEFRRLREYSGDNILKLVEDLVKRRDLNACIIIMHNYFYGFYEGYGSNRYDKYERYQQYLNIRYGYNGSEFYLVQEKNDEDE